MKKTVFLILLLVGLMVPWATQAQRVFINEDFNSGTLPSGWTNEYGWAFVSTSDGGYCARNNTGTSSNNKLITPVVDLSTVSVARLKFTYAQTLNNWSRYDRLQVFYRTSADGGWTLLFENATAAVGSFTLVEIELPNLGSTYQIGFGLVYNTGGGVFVDNVVVEENLCPSPVDLAFVDGTSTTATLQWTDRGTATAWQICLNGNEDNLVDANANPFTLTGLTPEAVYSAKVRAVCGTDEQSGWSDAVTFQPTDKLVIGPAQEDGSYRWQLPCNTGYRYSLTEQIYTAAELRGAGTILSIDFYGINNNNSDLYRSLDIYMVHTNQSGFASAADYITATEQDRVYSGSVDFQPGSQWTTIELDVPFNYDGTSNLAILVDDCSGWNVSNSYSYDMQFRTFGTDSPQTLYLGTNNNIGHNPTQTIGSFNSPVSEKNQIRLVKVTCMPVAGLAVGSVTNNAATFSWTERGNATSWVLEYADNEAFSGSTTLNVSGNPTTTVAGLTAGTQYFVRVKADCGGGDVSLWSAPIAFYTDFCAPEQKCEIFYELTFDYPENIGFNNGINVLDDATGSVIARLAMSEVVYDYANGEALAATTPEETDGRTYARGSFAVCNGRDIRFEWVNDSWQSDYCAYTFYNAYFMPIMYGYGSNMAFGDPADSDNAEPTPMADVVYTVSCTPNPCPRPTHVAVNYQGGTTATVTWDNVGSNYSVWYYNPDDYDDDHLITTTTNSCTITGLALGTTYKVVVKNICDPSAMVESYESRTVSFTTDLCMPEEQCAISYELYDANNDGWDGDAAIVVVDVTDPMSPRELTTWTIPSNSGGIDWNDKSGSTVETDGRSYARGTLNLCSGSVIAFYWQPGWCDGECTFTIYDASGAVIVSGIGGQYSSSGGEMLLDKSSSDRAIIATFSNDCNAPGLSANSWHAISAYKHDEGQNYLSLTNTSGGMGNVADLYRYNEATATWENQKDGTHNFTSLETCRGYIYRGAYYSQLLLNGTENAGSYTYGVTSTTTCPDADLRGFNLIGNPYPHPVVKGEDFGTTGLATGYYALAPDGSWRARLDSEPIAMGEAVLVKATNSTTLSFADNAAAPADPDMKGSATHGLRFAVAGGGHEDVAYALFDSEPSRAGADGLPKFAHLEAGLPSLSIVQGVNDYAIATFGKATESFPLKFSSKSKGEYTLTVDAEPWMGYLHLTDHVAVREVDLLHQPQYTFTHEGGQAAARFTVSLAPLSQDDAIFAYQSGSSVVVKGEGVLQVYDVMGRQLFANSVSTQLTLPCTQFPGTGVYILRLGEKTQKLVIK